MPKLSWREIYAGVLVLLIATILLVMQARENFSYYSDIVRSDDSTLTLNKNEVIDSIHTYFLIILGVLGGILLFRKRVSGWIISMALLVFYLSLALYGLIITVATGIFSAILVGIPTLILLPAVIFLVIPSALQKFRVSKKAILPTLLLFMALVGITFFLK